MQRIEAGIAGAILNFGVRGGETPSDTNFEEMRLDSALVDHWAMILRSA